MKLATGFSACRYFMIDLGQVDDALHSAATMIGIGFVNVLRTKPIPILKPARSDHGKALTRVDHADIGVDTPTRTPISA
jgi:hypothetical protein